MTRIPGRQRELYPCNWNEISKRIKTRAGWKCEACKMPNGKVPFVLTVHHIDFNPQNSADANLIALCQRCHLKVQGMMAQPRTRAEIITRLAAKGRQLYFK